MVGTVSRKTIFTKNETKGLSDLCVMGYSRRSVGILESKFGAFYPGATPPESVIRFRQEGHPEHNVPHPS